MPADEATDIAAIDLAKVLEHRGELSIVHHVPGRIRLRISRALGAKARGSVDPRSVDRLVKAVEGIEDLRVNPAVGSITIRYDSKTIEPEWWRTLLQGDSEEAERLLARLAATILAPALGIVAEEPPDNA